MHTQASVSRPDFCKRPLFIPEPTPLHTPGTGRQRRKCRQGSDTPENSTLIAPSCGRTRTWLRIGVLWAPVGERDEGSTPTTFSRIKIEPFIQDPEQDLLIPSKQVGYEVQGGSCPECGGAGGRQTWMWSHRSGGAGRNHARLSHLTDKTHPEKPRGGAEEHVCV